ncbi:MAG TPA: hypothetical protein VMT15_15910 [Bryobacteraceae bacterium]|nr:hypothetical protein [Bryobacteraceae bacterium]
MTRHVNETGLALYASGDMSLWQRASVGLHVRRCERCRERVNQFRSDAEALRAASAETPEGLDWARLSAEMTANIRVGLEAGECVAPRTQRKSWSIPPIWRPAAMAAGVMAMLTLLAGAWWLNFPAQDTQSLNRAMQELVHGRKTTLDDRGPVIEASPDGIELRKDGGALGVSQDSAQLLTVSVSTQGSASAHYADQDTGQITITSVYAQ